MWDIHTNEYLYPFCLPLVFTFRHEGFCVKRTQYFSVFRGAERSDSLLNCLRLTTICDIIFLVL
uniref:Uncharacterized protein n=1 Tax=Myoviridae sp. cthAo37 TaxID=2827701 RepID=A0A8S5S526_9CAUD|nr:MAG TPA: hypothetical protein [Myoviridae sp. cthAo37]